MGRTYDEAKANIDFAESKGLRLGTAPDIYLGAAYQTARKLIDDGWIGDPLNALAICIRGGRSAAAPGISDNPMIGAKGNTMPYDMGGYYVNALVSLLGPVSRVSGYAKAYDKRVYENPRHPNFLEPFQAKEGSSMMMGLLEHEKGCYSNLILCQEGFEPEIPRVEIFGTKGTLVVPDPNCFGGYGLDVYLTRVGNEGTFKVPFTHAYGDTDPAIPAKSGKREPCYNSHRGIAVADMAYAIRQDRPHRSSAQLALHTVEIISAIEQSTIDNQVHIMQSHPVQPAPLAHGLFGASAEASLVL
jgi:predicted dehydrogenase